MLTSSEFFDTIHYFLNFLFLTIIIEVVVAIIFGLRKKLEILTIILINLITNLPFNFILLVFSGGWSDRISPIYFILLEILIVLVEWQLLIYVLRQDKKKLLALSLTMNFCSSFLGAIILSFFNNFLF